MERLKSLLLPIIAETLERDGIKLRGIYERDDVHVRELEGLQLAKGWFEGFLTPASRLQ